MRQTGNLGLCLVEMTDNFSPEPLNGNGEILDQAVASLSRENLLENWYFADPVNTRGQSEYSGAVQYTVDRWKTSNANTTVTVGGGVTVTAAAADATPYLLHPIRDGKALFGKTVTLSVMTADGAVQWATATLPAAAPGTTSTYATITDCGHLLWMGGVLYVRLRGVTGGTNSFLAVKLEASSGQTLARKDANGAWVLNDILPNKGMELLKCCMSTADGLDTCANNRMTARAVGAAKVAAGSYTGTGTYGADNPCTLNFGFSPKPVVICKEDMGLLFGSPENWTAGATLFAVGGAATANRFSHAIGSVPYLLKDTFVWGADGFSWYTEFAAGVMDEELYSGVMQLNDSGVTYHYVAVG